MTDPTALGNTAAQILVTRSLIGFVAAQMGREPAFVGDLIQSEVSKQIQGLFVVDRTAEDSEQLRVAAGVMLAKLTDDIR